MIFFTIDIEAHELLETLMGRLKAGDKDALEKIYENTHGAVYALALSILKNSHDAQDIVHDTYLNLYRSAGSYTGMGKPMSYIMAITRNLSLMKIRERKRIADEPMEDWENYIGSAEGLSSEDRIIIRLCMNELTSEERQIIILHASAGFKHREIASELDMPLATVLSKYHRALKKLRDILQRG